MALVDSPSHAHTRIDDARPRQTVGPNDVRDRSEGWRMQARRVFSSFLVAGVCAALSSGSAALGHSQSMDFTVVERATTDAVIDVGEPGDTIGDMLAFGNDLFDEANVEVVGRDQGQCFRSDPGLSWECTWTNILADGSITVQGPFYDDLRDVDLAITGGTGAYAAASGTMTLHARDELAAELDFVFHVSPAASMGSMHPDDDGGPGDTDESTGDDSDS